MPQLAAEAISRASALRDSDLVMLFVNPVIPFVDRPTAAARRGEAQETPADSWPRCRYSAVLLQAVLIASCFMYLRFEKLSLQPSALIGLLKSGAIPSRLRSSVLRCAEGQAWGPEKAVSRRANRFGVGRAVLALCLLSLSTGQAQASAPTRWRVDPGPSSVQFRVRHLIFSQVEGSFRKFSGEVVAPNEDFSDAEITTTIPVDSVYTRHPDRDKELKGEDFFWASRYPEIRFQSTSVVRTGEQTYDVAGDLTIRGVTRPIVLEAELGGQRAISMGRIRADFRATGWLNRFDYGLRWNEVVEAGGALVGEIVEIELDVALVRETQPADARGSRRQNR